MSDEKAIERILTTARRHIDERNRAIRIADIARDLGVTRQTVYWYFPSTEALLQHTTMEETGPYPDRIQ
ncbi:helix-turn-helix domain-containing protein [Actinomadura welshii]|uniref:TetR/AcrR family transcriptional regulator n=1 Tax=Actinomadura welshii TaxID=3103817 RepID=UPI00190F3D98